MTKKVLFLHQPRTGGSYFKHLVWQNCKYNNYIYVDGWEVKGRDFTKDEIQEIINDKTYDKNVFVHQHCTGVDEETFLLSKNNGWMTVSFIRDMLDTICSVYFYHRKTTKWLQFHKDYYFDRSLDDFIKLNLEDKKWPWRLPSYWEEIDFIGISDRQWFDAALKKMNIDNHVDMDFRINTSINKGYNHYRLEKTISEESHNLLIETEEYQRQKQLITRIQNENIKGKENA